MMTWDKNQLRAEVEGYEDGHVVNWSNLAARYNVCNKSVQLAKNRGQIIKSWLISEGVDVTRFGTGRRKSNGIPISRRKKRRIVGGEISFPTEVHHKVLKQMLQEKLQIGTYSIGERIVYVPIYRNIQHIYCCRASARQHTILDVLLIPQSSLDPVSCANYVLSRSRIRVGGCVCPNPGKRSSFK